jgi:hypothetical protein
MPNLGIRAVKLGKFLEAHNCPKPYYIDEYLSSADKYQIPYELLPAISIQESSCGRHRRLNNWWGWNSARTGFVSVAAGIDFVAQQLSTSRYYKGKSLTQILNAYNPNPLYAPKIIGLMKEISNE